MAIPYQTAKFKSANTLAMAILGSTVKFNYFRLYSSLVVDSTFNQSENVAITRFLNFTYDSEEENDERRYGLSKKVVEEPIVDVPAPVRESDGRG